MTRRVLDAHQIRPLGATSGLGSAARWSCWAFSVVLIVTSPGWPAVRSAFFNLAGCRASPAQVCRRAQAHDLAVLDSRAGDAPASWLVIAVVRGLHGTGLHAAAARRPSLYTDIVRGIPTILLIFLFGFGIPALNLQGLPDSELFWGWAALVVSYSAYVAEVLRAGLESVHPSQRAAARALGLNEYQSLRLVVIPQAVRRVVPPLLNDFIALQKDTALIAILGAGIEMTRAAQIDALGGFNFTPFVVAACFYVLLTFRSLDMQTGSASGSGDAGSSLIRRAVMPVDQPTLQVKGVHKAYGDNAVLRGVSVDIDEHEVVALIGASGCGKSTLLRCIRRSRANRLGVDPARWCRHLVAGLRREHGPSTDWNRLSVVQSLSPQKRHRQRDTRAAQSSRPQT